MSSIAAYNDICSKNQNSPLELTSKTPSGFLDKYQLYCQSKTMGIDNEPAKYTYPIQITNPFERETWTVSTDHCYARPWNWRPESSFLKPTKSLFMPKNIGMKPLFSVVGSQRSVDDIIDVELDIEVPVPSYDYDKATSLMEECEKHASLARNSIDDENWEERINKTNWTPPQHRLFNGFVNILNNFYLGKMTYSGLKNEPVLRRIIIDKAVQRVRRLFNTVSYDTKLLQWIHQLLLDNLDQQNLASYLDILQTLKSKVSKFVEKLLNTPNSANRMGPLNNENLLPLLKKPWDPVETNLVQDKPKKLPSNPLIVLMPCSPNMSKRNQKWMALLTNLGQVLSVPTNFGSASHRMTMTNCIDQMFSLTRGRIQEIRENHPGRHIILVGFGAGATLAIQVAQVENVFCVVSLGFSMLTAEGRRGEPDDCLLELQCPVLFVIGQCSSTVLQEDMEDLRERMRIETGLIVVGSADNNLIVNKKKKREEGITQSIVDRCIIDEVGEFISSLILSPYPPQVRQSPTNIPAEAPKKGKLERKRYNSNTSSVESEPPSPTPARLPRPGRPAGKAKCKLEAKWAAQVAQGITPTTTNSNPVPPLAPLSPSPLTPNIDTSATTPSSSDTASAPESPIGPPIVITTPIKSEDLIKLGLSRKGRPPNRTPTKLAGAATDKAAQKNVLTSQKNVLTAQKNVQNTQKNVLTSQKNVLTTQKNVLSGEQGGSDQARLQAYNLGRNVVPGGQLSTLLQSGIKTIPAVQQKQGGTSSTSTIKVLENVQLSSQATAKLINSGGRTIDLSKLNLGQRSAGSNVMLLPDGKLKTLTSSRPITMKGSTGAPIMISMTGKGQPKRTKYITTKRLQANRQSPKPTVKRHTYLPFPQPIKTNLPPPTNLTSQDIMDLPIIFADDNQILDTNMPTDLSTTSTIVQQQAAPTKFIAPAPTNKYVILTKPTPTSGLSNFIITPTQVKRPNPVPVTKQPTKYTKIILSKKSVEPYIARVPSTTSSVNLTNLSQMEVMEHIDLENELIATAVPKPNMMMGDKKPMMGIITKKGTFEPGEQIFLDDDPDYVPPKNLKL